MVTDRGQALDTPTAARYLGVSISYLNKERMHDRGIPYLRVGRRVVYFERDLDRWIEQNTVRPSNQKMEAGHAQH